MSFTTEASRWRALSTRDPTANTHFLYTVKSTNVYCRPTCPARLARCKTPAEAEAAGYRACKRCKPDQPITEDPQSKAVAKACRLIDDAVERGDRKAERLQDLAKGVGLTPRYFHKVFKERTGLTPKEYARAKKQGAGGAREDPFLHQELNVLETLGIDAFDFNDLIDFDTDTSTSTQSASPSAAPEPYTPNQFTHGTGVDLDAFTMNESWNDTMGDFDDTAFFQQNVGLSSTEHTKETTTTFESDAALLLSDNTFLNHGGGTFGGMYV
jgi:methylphosphotriester-DNA--protein-cysteine methyltransferase